MAAAILDSPAHSVMSSLVLPIQLWTGLGGPPCVLLNIFEPVSIRVKKENFPFTNRNTSVNVFTRPLEWLNFGALVGTSSKVYNTVIEIINI